MRPTAFAVLAGIACFIAINGTAFAADHPPPAKAPFHARQAMQFQRQWAGYIGKPVVYTNSIGMTFVLIPPGEFTMGRTEEQFDRVLAEGKKHGLKPSQLATWEMLMMPAHRVRITKPFYLGATEVTVGQFRRFCDATGYKTEAERGLNHGKPYKGRRPISTWRQPMRWINLKQKDDEPVLHLCWNDCVAFCKWLSKKEGIEYCLPTEAEWEYACRAGTTTAWSFGNFEDFDRLGHQYMFVSDGWQKKHDRPSRVAQKKPNPFGLYDMHGNVWEYVADWWHRYTYKNSPLNDPTGPVKQSEKGDMRRIIRAGSFDWGRWGAQSVYRMRITQRSTQHPHMGFRVAMRIRGVNGIPPAEYPRAEQRRQLRDPGAEAPEVVRALKAGAASLPNGGRDLPKQLAVDIGGGQRIEFVLIPAGSFVMGSDKGGRDEQPRHRVVISKPFYMAKYELTRGQWEAVMGRHQALAKLTAGDKAMEGPTKAMNLLSWDDCRRLIGKLSHGSAAKSLAKKLPGITAGFALPTEAQWEYACRAGTTTEFSFGDDPAVMSQYAWYQGNARWPNMPAFAGQAAYPDVGQKKPNAFGLHDMHGGVWEWCADWYNADYYLTSPLVDPTGPKSGRFRVQRGGSWFRYPEYARSAYRKFFFPAGDSDGITAWINDFGCRLVINMGPDRAPSTSDSRKPPRLRTARKKRPAAKDRTVNYTKLARSLRRAADNPVITVGKKGAWDDQTLGCFTVLHDGGRFYLYSGGTQFGKPKKIGMATSRDGIHWTKFERNPLFPGSMPYAIKVGNVFRLYHPGKDAAGRSGLLMRTSKDGFHWSNPTLVFPGGILDPCVIRVADHRFHLYYCSGGRKTKNGKRVWEFKNYAAVSSDGIHWKKHPRPILPLGPPGSWDAASHAGPVVLKLPDGQFHLWYLGSGHYKGKTAWRVGHAVSRDGLRWTKSGTEPVLDIGKPGAWDGGTLMSFDIIFRNGRFLFWYAAAPTGHGDETRMTIQIGHGVSR